MRSKPTAWAAVFMLCLFNYGPASAQCSLNIESVISSSWGKKNVSYVADKNILKIKAGAGAINDADSIYIGSVKGCSVVTVNVSQISGEFPWGGKAIGFSFANEKLDPQRWGSEASFPPPRGREMEAGFIKPPLSSRSELVYEIKNSGETTHIGAKVFIGSGVALELQFSAQQEPGAQSAARPKPYNARVLPKRYDASPLPRMERAAMSCSANCHAPRGTGYDQPAFRGNVSTPYGADCPHDDEGITEPAVTYRFRLDRR